MSGIRLFRESDALIVVDVQPTFMPGGGLAVRGGDEVVPIVRDMMEKFDKRFATLDRHPRGHISLASSYVWYEGTGVKDVPQTPTPPPMSVLTKDFITIVEPAPHAAFGHVDLHHYVKEVGSQVLWPDHAIAGTAEAELHPDLPDIAFDFIQVKGMDPECDSYSGFYDNLRRPTGFADIVAASGAKRLFICGLAYDFCVGWTALDARVALPNTAVFVIEDACRSVDMPGSVEAMNAALEDASIQRIKNDFWL